MEELKANVNGVMGVLECVCSMRKVLAQSQALFSMNVASVQMTA